MDETTDFKQLEEITVKLKNGKIVRVVAPLGTSKAEAIMLAEAQEAGVGDVESEEDLDAETPPTGGERFEPIPFTSTDPTEADRKRNQMFYGGLGAGAGATKTGIDVGLNLFGRTRDALMGPRGTVAAAANAMRAPLSDPNLAATQRILQGTTDDAGTTGRARQTGYNVETAQQAARQKEAQGILSELQKRGLTTGSDPFARAPGMTSSPSGILMPRSAAMEPPRPPAAPTTAPRPSALSAITDQFMRRAKPGASLLAKYLGPTAGGLAAGLSVGDLVTEMQKQKPDPINVGGASLGALGGVLSMFPATAPVGIPLAIGSSMLRAPTEEERRFRDMQATESPFAYGP